MNGGSDLSVDIDKFTISVSGLTIIGFAKWSSLGEMPSMPVAFFTFILLIQSQDLFKNIFYRKVCWGP
jgi:hypothetical protein